PFGTIARDRGDPERVHDHRNQKKAAPSGAASWEPTFTCLPDQRLWRRPVPAASAVVAAADVDHRPARLEADAAGRRTGIVRRIAHPVADRLEAMVPAIAVDRAAALPAELALDDEDGGDRPRRIAVTRRVGQQQLLLQRKAVLAALARGGDGPCLGRRPGVVPGGTRGRILLREIPAAGRDGRQEKKCLQRHGSLPCWERG